MCWSFWKYKWRLTSTLAKRLHGATQAISLLEQSLDQHQASLKQCIRTLGVISLDHGAAKRAGMDRMFMDNLKVECAIIRFLQHQQRTCSTEERRQLLRILADLEHIDQQCSWERPTAPDNHASSVFSDAWFSRQRCLERLQSWCQASELERQSILPPHSHDSLSV